MKNHLVDGNDHHSDDPDHERGQDVLGRQHLEGEDELLHQTRVAEHRRARTAHRGLESEPWDQTREHVGREIARQFMCTTELHSEHDAKEENVEQGEEQWVPDHPYSAQKLPRIALGEIAFRHLDQQTCVAPHQASAVKKRPKIGERIEQANHCAVRAGDSGLGFRRPPSPVNAGTSRTTFPRSAATRSAGGGSAALRGAR